MVGIRYYEVFFNAEHQLSSTWLGGRDSRTWWNKDTPRLGIGRREKGKRREEKAKEGEELLQ